MATGRGRPRAEWGSINRAAVLESAVRLASAEGLEKLNARRLAASLAVSPMAIYRHVASMDEVVDEVVGHLLTERWRPRVAKREWRAWSADAADRLRRFLVENPAALQVYLRRPVASATALVRMEAFLGVLRAGLGDDTLAHRAYAAVQTYTIGFAALESARAAHDAVPAAGADADLDRALLEMAAYASPEQFRAGLDYLLDGIAAEAGGRR